MSQSLDFTFAPESWNGLDVLQVQAAGGTVVLFVSRGGRPDEIKVEYVGRPEDVDSEGGVLSFEFSNRLGVRTV